MAFGLFLFGVATGVLITLAVAWLANIEASRIETDDRASQIETDDREVAHRRSIADAYMVSLK